MVLDFLYTDCLLWFVAGNAFKEGNEGDHKVHFQKDTMVIFASAEDDSNWQGIFQLNFQMTFGTISFYKKICNS